MSPLIMPARLRLTRDELATVVRDGRLPSGESVTDEARVALRTALDPKRLTVVLSAPAGGEHWRETRFAVGGSDGPVAAEAAANGALDLALLPSPALAAVMIDDLLGLTAYPAASGPSLELTLSGFAVLCAAADAHQEALLQARLRREAAPRTVLTADSCEAYLRRGLDTNDSRWAVTAARLALATDLRGVVGTCPAGLDEVTRLGIVEATTGGRALTAAGLVLATTFTQLVYSGNLTLVAADREGGIVAPLAVLRSIGAIWLASLDARGGRTRVTLVPATVAGALEVVRRMLAGDIVPLTVPAPAAHTPVVSPAPATPTPRFCGHCGRPLRSGARFCGSCGREVLG